MAKNKISEWSSTPANNTDIGGIDIAEGCAPSGINNAIRELMAQVRDWQAGTDDVTLPISSGGTGSTTAADARTALSAAKSGANEDITSLSGLTTTLSIYQGGTGLLKASISTVARASNVATITTTEAHGFAVNDYVTVSGVTTSGFNTTALVTAVSTNTFTYANSGSDVPATSDTTGKAYDISYLDLTDNTSGVLTVNKGGTGLTTITANSLMAGNGTSTPNLIAPSTSGNVLKSNGTSWESGTITTITTTVGSSPYYGARAFANFNSSVSADYSCTYSQSGTTITVTLSSGTHTLVAGNRAYFNFTSGTASDGVYTIATVISNTQFTLTSETSTTTTGAVTVQGRTINNAKNISYVSYISTGNYIVNFSTAMNSVYYSPVLTANTAQSRLRTDVYSVEAMSFPMVTEDAAGGDVNVTNVNVVVFE